jgi:ATP-dependent helicase HepA
LVDSLADYVRWDDRGQTFVFWRTSQHIQEASLYFRFDYVIEADTGPARRILETRGGKFERRALQRRADEYLPPRIVTLWSEVDGTDIDDGTLIDLLDAPYEPRRGDINLNPERRWALDELIGESDWEWRCRTARTRSEAALRSQPSFAASCADAVSRFEAASRTAVTQRRIRLTFLPIRQRAAEESEMAADIDIDAALSLGMQEPHVRLDAIGAVVLSPYRPQGRGFTRQPT